MVINSSNVYMESGRQFQAKQVSGSNLTIGNQASISENVVNIRDEEANKIHNFTDMLKDEMIDDSTADMENSMLGMRSGSATVAKMNAAEDMRSLQMIQEHSIIYILRNFRQLMLQGFHHQNRNGFQNSLNKARGQEVYNQRMQDLFRTVGQQLQSFEGTKIGSYTNYYGYAEEENTTFTTAGKVVTADGREIDFNIDVAMSRSFEEYVLNSEDIMAYPTANLIDPLVINLNNNVANVSDQKFFFDLDCDGTLDEVSMLDFGSGFLALDKNGDGKINDGSELFGTSSGDGFKDLAKFDLDGNGWIDENDEIFDQLRIWAKDADGNDVMYSLKEAGVGAICLQKASTNFSLNNLEDNTTNAVIRQTGIFLYENGGVGTVQHLDLAT